MQILSTDEVNTDTEIVSPIGRVQILNGIWTPPTGCLTTASNNHLEFSFVTRSHWSWACYPDKWDTHRFEPVGKIFLIPAQQLIYFKSEGRYQNSIIIDFYDENSFPAASGARHWTDRRLRKV